MSVVPIGSNPVSFAPQMPSGYSGIGYVPASAILPLPVAAGPGWQSNTYVTTLQPLYNLLFQYPLSGS